MKNGTSGAADLKPGTALRDMAVRHLANVLAVVQRVQHVEGRQVSHG